MKYKISHGNITQILQKAIDQKIPPFGCQTPKLFELISSSIFKETKDLSFIRYLSVAGAQLSPAMYQRIEKEFEIKSGSDGPPCIRKYLNVFYIQSRYRYF